MPSYKLSHDARQDIQQVTRYTQKIWGAKAAHKYTDGLKDIFEAIGKGAVKKRAFSRTFPELLVTKHRYHYIFYYVKDLKRPGIVGVIHERRDIVSRLSDRLS
ncbi:MAG: type II toxin-antitoxin system RelE/ParE family toxin [Gammaproteobacteria bacterium]|nr:type II toxin-antitoxin system RelE/ParE family toxin [Gammaproteobacteria bacterium]